MHRRLLLLIAMFFALPAFADDKADWKKLEGDWTPIGMELAGNKFSAEQYKDCRLTITEGKYNLVFGGQTDLGFTRAQVTQGFLLGFLAIGLPFGLLAGVLIDKIGARLVILSGVGFIGLPLILMGFMNHFWEYQLLCILEVIGYVLAGPIANQVLIAHWFHARRGRAMGYAYLGLGLGGAISPPTINWLLRTFGWRHALEIVGAAILVVLFPLGLLVTRSTPSDCRPSFLATINLPVAGAPCRKFCHRRR